jgi:DNA-binding SARP family transcriptional activator
MTAIQFDHLAARARPEHRATQAPGAQDLRPLWRVRVMGGLQLHNLRDSQPLKLPVKLRQFLLHLLYARLRGPMSMAEICDTLWLDSDGSAARNNLYSAVHRLRQHLGSSQALHVEDSWVWLDEQLLEVDLDRLRAIREALGGLHPLGADALQDLGTELLVLTRSGGLLPPGTLERPPIGVLRNALLCWRSTTRELACQLDASGRTTLAIRLCERFTEYGVVDEGLLDLWTQLLIKSGQHIAARHVAEQYGPQCRTL